MTFNSVEIIKPIQTCNICPRLEDYRLNYQQLEPSWHNAPVDSFGPLNARLLIVGLAPGLRGANRTGRPFTGDFAGELLYPTLIKFGFAKGTFKADPNDGIRLVDCRITNAVRCVPPKNKPTSAEINSCKQFLSAEVKAMNHVKVFLCLGSIAHKATLNALSFKPSFKEFKHNAIYTLPNGKLLIDSYHCSRLNTNTKRLTKDMFESVFANICKKLEIS